ncbi:hypothetical protein ACN3XK_44050 [Actinomadura welshii]
MGRRLAGRLRWAGVTTVGFWPEPATADAGTGRRAAHAEARDLGERF